MASGPSQDHKNLMYLLYPYMFMLKEGPQIKMDSLDYSLLILQTKSETLPSPASYISDVQPSDILLEL